MSGEPPRRKDIKQEEMVKWLSPTTLFRSGLEVFVSGVFARFADKREIQAGLPWEQYPHGGYSVDDDEPFWLDFASDVGDGFDSTYTIAWLLAQRKVPLTWGGTRHETERGRLLVLGGDQVYPAADWDWISAANANRSLGLDAIAICARATVISSSTGTKNP